MSKEFFTVLPVSEARKVIMQHLPEELRSSRRRSLLDSLGRRLACPLTAAEDVPGFARTTVDGFAVRSKDTFGATEGTPAYLMVTGEVRMGVLADRPIGYGEAVKVATGSMLPEGADAAVMIEHTEPLASGEIEVTRAVAPGENIIFADEDIKAGSVIFQVNHLFRPQDLGFLAAVGELEVETWDPLKVGIISTGDEVVPPEIKPGPAQVRDVNSYTLAGSVLRCGGQPVLYDLVKDDREKLRKTLRQALEKTDLVIISGGSSVGTRDLTTDVLSELGNPGLVFHGLAIRPGKPTMGAVIGKTPVIGLPGHPAAALISFDLMVAPLLKFGNYREDNPGALPLPALLSRSLASASGREEYIRVRLRREEEKLWADPLLGKSGLLSPMVKGDGLVRIPLEREGFAAGSLVDVYLFATDYQL